MREQTPLPNRIAWFAPWIWLPKMRPWLKWTLGLSLVAIGYVLSMVPVLLVVSELGYGDGDAVGIVLNAMYFPVMFVAANSTTVASFIEWETVFLFDLFLS